MLAAQAWVAPFKEVLQEGVRPRRCVAVRSNI